MVASVWDKNLPERGRDKVRQRCCPWEGVLGGV